MENKYQKVKDSLREAILAGEYAIDEKLPTESELMARFSVSRYTIRRAVGDLETEHYIYRIQGGGMFVQDWRKDWSTDNNSKIIGVIATHVADYIFPQIIYGIDQVISDGGYSLLLGNTHNNHQRERKNLINMLNSNVAGLIIEPTQSALDNPNMDLYQEIKDDGIPVLFINASYPNLDFQAITTNDQDAEQRMIEYLFEMGHESILGIFQVDDIQGVHRMNGFVKAYQEQPEISYKSNILMYQSGDDFDKLAQRLDAYLQNPSRPTAIACYNDQLAIRVMDYLKGRGLKLPADISIVGFDDYHMSQYMSPGITTMNHEKTAMGEDTGKQMLRLLNKQPVESIKYDPQLIVRDSVADLN
ncbi:GntR family transcriptional regulator [Lactiplantibacillus pentosus]|uniref:Arabinose operon repressor n=2 Tax=Lactiplantibacillus pentosus TaxID=1589 RepID=G0M4Q0_LACPE|nr:GntR family transcriptional regulator [Lactiplantibacillus pentosus]CCC17184.1 arabinose operon repressor [Lactiplantibacillus pentosus IG1]MCT3301874.1 GntR family transcriptional regulator [Lactiplantibacillus pentosus]PRO82392.1 GntR family transcriptional regulator [Lactiplantibacillus pentosus]PRO84146.1 GntR family transcriptional regulator [Lactiplantibacillus pentosus]PRO93724.1 GntR family transcriptional regulator [Lactiplantibacillus pentosus]